MPSKIPLEQEYAFVLSCLQSSLDNGGKIDFGVVASQHDTTAGGAQQRIRRCQKSAGSVAAEPKKEADKQDPEDTANPVNAAKRNLFTFLHFDVLIAFVLLLFVKQKPVTDFKSTRQVAKPGCHAGESQENGGSKKRKLNEMIGRVEETGPKEEPIKDEPTTKVEDAGV